MFSSLSLDKLDKLQIKQLQSILKEGGFTSSFERKELYINKIKKLVNLAENDDNNYDNEYVIDTKSISEVVDVLIIGVVKSLWTFSDVTILKTDDDIEYQIKNELRNRGVLSSTVDVMTFDDVLEKISEEIFSSKILVMDIDFDNYKKMIKIINKYTKCKIITFQSESNKIKEVKKDTEIVKSVNEMISDNDENNFINIIRTATENFFLHGSRSSKKVDIIHNFIKQELEKTIKEKSMSESLSVKVECKVPSINEANNKRCDVVVFKKDKPFIIFPVKFIMSNYKQNKNNFWENLTGEVVHLKHANKDLNIIPLNIIFNSVPYLNNKKIIVKFEDMTIDNSFGITSKLIEWSFCSDVINLIINVEHTCKVGEEYKQPNIISFDKKSAFLPFSYYLNRYL